MMTTNRRTGSTLLRYLLWQIPGWLLAGVLLVAIAAVTGLSWWIVPAVLLLFVARDVALYPAMRAVFRPASPTRPIGARGIAVDDLRPTGMVRVQGELWRARAIGDVILAEQDVIVTSARGLTLLVKRPDRD